MKLYTEDQVKSIIESIKKTFEEYGSPDSCTIEWDELDKLFETYNKPKPIELPSDEEIIGRFMNWFLKHYSTATIDGMFGYVNSMEQEVTIREILDHYFNKEQILNQNK